MKAWSYNKRFSQVGRARAARDALIISLRAVEAIDLAAAAVLLGWLCALLYVQQSLTSHLTTDSIIDYYPAAQRFLMGWGWASFKPEDPVGPGYPVMLALTSRLLGLDLFTAGKFLSIVASMAALLLSYLLLRRTFGPVTGLAAILLMMAVNSFAYISCESGTDVVFLALFMAASYCLSRQEMPRWWEAALAGLCAGIAVTVRMTGVLLFVYLVLRLALVPRAVAGLLSRLRLALAFVLGMAPAAAPWLYQSYHMQQNTLSIRGTIGLDPTLLPESGSLLPALFGALRASPIGFSLRFLAKMATDLPKVAQGFNGDPAPYGWVMAGPFWILIALGLVLALVRPNRLRLWLLLGSAVWWASLVPIHFEARYYLPVLPTLAALAVWTMTGQSLPDLWVMPEDGRPRFSPGALMKRWRSRMGVGAGVGGQAEMSLLTLAVIAGLSLAVVATFQHVDVLRAGDAYRKGFYRELGQYVRGLAGGRLMLPVGARQWSLARYWVPREAGIPVLPLPGEDYRAVLPSLSYVLYDQIDDRDSIINWWDDPRLTELANPMTAPSPLEAVYYRSESYRAILYRVLAANDIRDAIALSASTTSGGTSAAQAGDRDAATWWSSAPHDVEETDDWLTLDLGATVAVNRLCLFPRPEGAGFPAALTIEVSEDGQAWQLVAQVQSMDVPRRQDPRVIPFGDTHARYVRLNITRMRWQEDAQGFLASLAEVRVSHAVERSTDWPTVTFDSADLSFDPRTSELVVALHNVGRSPAAVAVEFRRGWSEDTATLIGKTDAVQVNAGAVAEARLSSRGSAALAPGICEPIWARAQPQVAPGLDLDTYEMKLPEPQQVFGLVCAPKELALVPTLFASGNSLAAAEGEWHVPSDQGGTGKVVVSGDLWLQEPTLQVTTDSKDGFLVRHDLRAQKYSRLSMWVRSETSYIVCVGVVSQDKTYQVQYMPYEWPSYPEAFPQGPYVYYALGENLVDGKWHQLDRDVYADFRAKTGLEPEAITGISLRAFDRIEFGHVRFMP